MNDDRQGGLTGWMRGLAFILVLAVLGEGTGLAIEYDHSRLEERRMQDAITYVVHDADVEKATHASAELRLRRVEEEISALDARHHDPHAEIEFDRLCVCLIPDARRVVCRPPGEGGCVMAGKDWCEGSHPLGSECCSLSEIKDLTHPCARLGNKGLPSTQKP
jgi:hypothetical protein